MSALEINVNTVNKIKVESVEEMEESIFSEVYKKAEGLLEDIISNNATVELDNKIQNEQIPNIIAFLGARGRGKTSAMLSFLLYLDEFNKGDNSQRGDEQTKFLTLPYIDAAILAEKEFVLDVILAKMWDQFEAYNKRNSNTHKDAYYVHLERKVKDGFVNVRKSYLTLKEKENDAQGKRADKDESVAGGLHELSVSMNLRQEFQELVKDYIGLFSYDNKSHEWDKGYLVLAIDDIDMSGNKAQSILEQIRRFLTIPKMVILISADIDRLKQMCASHYVNLYSPLKAMQSLHVFINDYLEKVLPLNMRIYMPELNENHDGYSVSKDAFSNWQPELKNTKEKDLILEIMASKCEIYFDICRHRRHFLQNASLRMMVNYFKSVSCVKEGEWSSWLKCDLKDRIMERLNDDQQRSFVSSLLTKDYEEMNNAVISYINIHDLKLFNFYENNLGNVLYLCSLLEEQDAQNVEFVNCIIYLYSIILAQNSDAELKSKIVGNSIFGNWEYGILSSNNLPQARILGFDNRNGVELIISDVVQLLMKAYKLGDAVATIVELNKKEILGWLYTLLYVEIENFEDSSFDYRFSMQEKLRPIEATVGEGTNNTFITVRLNAVARKRYLGFMIHAKDEKERLTDILRGALKELINYISLKYNSHFDDIDIKETIDRNCDIIMKDIDFGDCKTEEFPQQNVEIIYSIGKALGNDPLNGSGNAIEMVFDRMKYKYRLVKSELERRDKAFKEISIPTSYSENFEKNIQVRIFTEPDFFKDYDTKTCFMNQFKKVFVETPNQLINEPN